MHLELRQVRNHKILNQNTDLQDYLIDMDHEPPEHGAALRIAGGLKARQ